MPSFASATVLFTEPQEVEVASLRRRDETGRRIGRYAETEAVSAVSDWAEATS